jgi:chromosome segregation ATPase
MKRPLVVALALAVAMPAVTLPVTTADAQVLTGGNAPRRQAPRPRLSEAELDRLTEAEDQIFEIDDQIADIQAAAEAAGGLTPAQQTQIDDLTRRRAEAQRTVDRLEAKRNR